MAWGDEWLSVTLPSKAKVGDELIIVGPALVSMPKSAEIVWPKAPADTSNSGVVINQIYQASRELNNKVPTHDPYTNPNAFIYYQCDCGQVLDPHTKSFAELNNHASRNGWKIRWKPNGAGYQPFCAKCAVGVE